MMDFMKHFLSLVGIFFIIYLIGYSTFLFLSVAVGSSVLYRSRRLERFKNELMSDFYIPVSIIVPACNEEITVVDTVISLLGLEYTLYEIVVVDDGSRDETARRLIDHFDMRQVLRPVRKQVPCRDVVEVYEAMGQRVPLTLVRKRNGGKADALNMGINASRYPYFICMDADSMLQYDSLRRIVTPVIENDNVVAVGGLVRVSNGVALDKGRVAGYSMPKNILAAMQVLEYDRSFLASRIMLDQFNGNLIISGAFGMFQKEMVVAAGGYDDSTLGEDMELVVKLHLFCRLHGIPYSIKYAPNAVCWSQAPENLKDLMKQRRRWHIGLCQSMWKHRQIFGNPKYGLVSFISYLYFLIYETLSPIIEVFGIFTILLAFGVGLINVPYMALFFLIYASFGAILSLTAFFARIHTQDLRISLRDAWKAILLCLVEISGLRFILMVTRLAAMLGYRKKKAKWGKIQRRRMDIKS